MRTVDAKGKLCPLPLIMTKKALTELQENESLDILLDNETSLSNVSHFLNEYKMQFIVEKQGKDITIHVNKTGIIPDNAKAEDFCVIPDNTNNNYIILIKSKYLGEGAEELGEILIKGFINTLPDIDNKPEKIIFLNSGIFLSLNDSPVLESLKKLENLGVEILICGTCLDYYKKKEQIGAGHISNMYDILDSLTKASKVIEP
jgi:selenium metabolism protein YedF